MGSGKKRTNTPTGMSAQGVLSVGGQVVVDCSFNGAVAATPSEDSVDGAGQLALSGREILLVNEDRALAILQPPTAVADRLRHCLEQGYSYIGVLRSTRDGWLVDVRPRS